MSDDHNASRRTFLKNATFVIGGLISAGIIFPAVNYVLAPLFKHDDEEWIQICAVSAVPMGEPVKIDYVKRQRDGWMVLEERSSAWVVTTDGKEYVAYDPRCTHLGCPYRWDAAKNEFLCPCHAGVFSITGQVMGGPPPRPLKRYPTRVQDGNLWIQMLA